MTRKHLFHFWLCFCCSLVPGLGQATTYQTVAHGSWTSPSIWSTGTAPPVTVNSSDLVIIKHNVTAPNATLTVKGTSLAVNAGASLTGTGTSAKLLLDDNGTLSNYGTVTYYSVLLSHASSILNNKGLLTVNTSITSQGIIVNSTSSTVKGNFTNKSGQGRLTLDAGSIFNIQGNFEGQSSTNVILNGVLNVGGNFKTGGSFTGTVGGHLYTGQDIELQSTATYPSGVTVCSYINHYSPAPPAGSINCSVLPVENLSFSVSASDNGVQLRWSAEGQNGVSYYEPQRSLDGFKFEACGINEEAVGGSGPGRYAETDGNAPLGLLYYRIRVVDNNGSEHFSAVERVVNQHHTIKILEAFPNPFVDDLDLEIENDEPETVTITLYNQTGEEIFHDVVEEAPGLHDYHMHIANLDPGLYFIRVSDGKDTKIFRVMHNGE